VFGRYGSQRMKDWQEVVRLYEKDSLYLAEAAQILVRLVSYEIPGLRKQISKFEQLSEESEKKTSDLVRSQHNLQTEFNAICSQLGIKGDNVRDELIEKLKELPALLAAVSLKETTLYSVFYKLFSRLPQPSRPCRKPSLSTPTTPETKTRFPC
jgi:CDK5 regulatory subunit-associated protein 3